MPSRDLDYETWADQLDRDIEACQPWNQPGWTPEKEEAAQIAGEAYRERLQAEADAEFVYGACAGCGKAIESHYSNFQCGCAFCSQECEHKAAFDMWGWCKDEAAYQKALTEQGVPY